MTSRSLAAPAWALLALFVVYASTGTWTSTGPGIWAPGYLSWPDLAQNILIYLPFGALGGLTLRHRRQSAFASTIEVAVIGVLFSLFVEVMQLYTIERTASLTDVFAAALGSTVGGMAAGTVGRLGDRAIAIARPSGVLDAANTPVVLVLIGAMLLLAWWPYEPTLDVSWLAARARLLQREPWQFEPVSTVAQALLYLCLSLAVALSADRLRTFEAMLAGVGVALTAAVVLDAGQLAMGSQPIGLAGLAAQIAGALSGGALFAMCRVPK